MFIRPRSPCTAYRRIVYYVRPSTPTALLDGVFTRHGISRMSLSISVERLTDMDCDCREWGLIMYICIKARAITYHIISGRYNWIALPPLVLVGSDFRQELSSYEVLRIFAGDHRPAMQDIVGCAFRAFSTPQLVASACKVGIHGPLRSVFLSVPVSKWYYKSFSVVVDFALLNAAAGWILRQHPTRSSRAAFNPTMPAGGEVAARLGDVQSCYLSRHFKTPESPRSLKINFYFFFRSIVALIGWSGVPRLINSIPAIRFPPPFSVPPLCTSAATRRGARSLALGI